MAEIFSSAFSLPQVQHTNVGPVALTTSNRIIAPTQASAMLTPHQKHIINSTWHYFDANKVDWKTYTFPKKLNWAQYLCIQFIRCYQHYTRGEGKDTLIGRQVRKRYRTGIVKCTFKELGHLGCSEYATVMIAELGVIPGIIAYKARSHNYDFVTNRDMMFDKVKRKRDIGRPYFVPVLV